MFTTYKGRVAVHLEGVELLSPELMPLLPAPLPFPPPPGALPLSSGSSSPGTPSELSISRSSPPRGPYHRLPGYPYLTLSLSRAPRLCTPVSHVAYRIPREQKLEEEGVIPGPNSLSGPGDLSSGSPWDCFCLAARLRNGKKVPLG